MPAQPDVRTILDALHGHGDLEAALDAVLALPADEPMRARLAADLVVALMRTGLVGGMGPGLKRIGRIEELVAIADSDPPPDPRWRRVRALARVTALMGSATDQRLASPSDALRELDELAAEAGNDPAARMLVETARLALTYVRDSQDGDQSVFARLIPDLERLRDTAATTYPQASEHGDFLLDSFRIMASRQNDGDAARIIAELDRSVGLLPSDSPARKAMQEAIFMIGAVLPSRAGVDGSEALSTAQQLAAVEKQASRPGLSDVEKVNYHLTAGGVALGGWTETDVGLVTAGIEHFRSAVALMTPEHPQYAFCLTSVALGLLRRSELTNAPADLAEAEDALETARQAAGGPQHPVSSLINEMLSGIKLRRGSPGSREAVLDGLRGTTWNVLLQGTTTAARFAARGAAGSAISAAWQCLRSSDPEGAIQALDEGRALMLFAATELGDVESRLRDAGRADLAERWRAEAVGGEPDRMPTNLRREVLTVLSERSGLLDPPSLGQIRKALRVLDADVLVYLVPAGDDTAGWAVIAPVVGNPSYIPLPNLRVGKDQDVERYLSALGRRDLAPAGQQRTDLAGSLDALCDWAWRAAVGPIVEQYLPKLPKPASGRPHRIVLVPMGELALVPWQAARRRDGVYAVELAAFSQTASARMLCRSAACAPVPPTPVGLVVGDPDIGDVGDRLVAARIEAYAIHQAFYRGGRYVGTRADGTPSRAGAGTGDEVRDWLATTRPGVGAMLHLACHGVIETGGETPTSYLLLAGGDRFTAEEIVGTMARSPERAVGLAVLAACHTGQSVYGYDEAYSIGTAFLAGGVRSVLSTQWAVPDGATSVLMFMFHHCLMVRRLPVWDALRQAQLWMLDPDREIPETMPATLRRRLGESDLARIDAWAGFVHQGQ